MMKLIGAPFLRGHTVISVPFLSLSGFKEAGMSVTYTNHNRDRRGRDMFPGNLQRLDVFIHLLLSEYMCIHLDLNLIFTASL